VRFRRPGVLQLSRYGSGLPPLAPLVLGWLPLQLGTGGHGVMGPVFQIAHQREGFVNDLEDVAPAGDSGQMG
jgi:hypothetical protein